VHTYKLTTLIKGKWKLYFIEDSSHDFIGNEESLSKHNNEYVQK